MPLLKHRSQIRMVGNSKYISDLAKLNLKNIVKLTITVGHLKDLKLQGIAKLRDLTLRENGLRRNDKFYEVPGKILK